MNRYFWGGAALWGALLLALLALAPRSPLHRKTLERFGRKKRALTLVVMVAVILAAVLPMGLSPVWNGQDPGHRDQYERMTDALLEGHLYLDVEVNPALLALENPYDPDARDAAGASYRWDHAFYNNRYYMYFGVVPVFLLFLPYRLATGVNLTTYHATQVFVALYICGVFALLLALARRFFPKLSLALYLLLSAAFSWVSVWPSVGAPAMYCTAISSALCLEVWSLYFFARAVWFEERDWRGILWAALGSLLGALAFGCRPPVALGNLLVLPMLAAYLHRWKLDAGRVGKLLLAASPYAVVAALLMAYNHARFGNPFEFGQSYQLTTFDISAMGSLASRAPGIIHNAVKNFIGPVHIVKYFPFTVPGGALVNFPILAFPAAALVCKPLRRAWRERRLLGFVSALFLLPLLITVMDCLWSPAIIERYHMDIYWLMCLLCFLAAAACHAGLTERGARRFSFWMSLWALVTLCTCAWFCIVPNDGNLTSCRPELLAEIQRVLTLGLFRG